MFNLCKQKSHFTVKYLKKSDRRVDKRVHLVTDNSSSKEWIYSIDNTSKDYKTIKCRMVMGQENIVFQIDTGSPVNMLTSKYASNISNNLKKMWNNVALSSCGESRHTIRNQKNNQNYSVNFVVFEGEFVPLLGYRASKQMQLITVNAENFDKIAAVDISNNYDDVFDASTIGTLGTHHHLEITNVLWVNQLVITLKDTGAVRVCIDPRELNKSLLREHYTLLILDETLHQIGQSRVFSPVDLSSEYWHVVLDKECSLLTTFQTPFGRYRRCRLPFGTCSSADILQKKLLDALEGLPGVTCIVDDVLIHANTTEKHHQLFLKRCQETGIKSHKSKLQL